MRLRVTVEDITNVPVRVARIEVDEHQGYFDNGERVTSFYVRSDSLWLGKVGSRDLSKRGLVVLAANALRVAVTSPTQGTTSLEQKVDTL